MPHEQESTMNQKETLSYQKAGKKQSAPQKKKFVKPTLKRHDALPEVTTGFLGTYNP